MTTTITYTYQQSAMSPRMGVYTISVTGLEADEEVCFTWIDAQRDARARKNPTCGIDVSLEQPDPYCPQWLVTIPGFVIMTIHNRLSQAQVYGAELELDMLRASVECNPGLFETREVLLAKGG